MPLPPRDSAVSLWRNRDFLLLWSGQLVSSFGGEISSLALPLLILTLTGSAAQAGFAAALSAVPALLIGLPAGALIDRWDRKRVMIICDVLRALTLASIPLALALGRLTMLQIYLVSLVQGGCQLFFLLARLSALPKVVTRTQLPDAVARNEVSESAITLVGPPLGGAVFGLGRAIPFLVDALSYAASVISLLFIRIPFQEQRTLPSRALRHEVAEGLRWLLSQPLLRFMSLIYGGFALFLSGTGLCLIVLARQRGASPLGIGLIFAAGGAGGLIGALVAPAVRRRWRFGRIIPLLQWMYALLQPLYALLPGLVVLGIVEALLMVNDQIYDVVWPSYRIALIPDALQGRVTSAYLLVPRVLRPLGLAFSGVLIQRVGAGPALVVLAGGLALLALAVTLNPDVRHAGAGDPLPRQ
ncbi:MAG: MFS transporter [Ktedonobacterales bacterium]|nr:MFS transporter [Ktedonobacterales bacterium]